MRTISAIFVIMAIFASVSLNAQSWTSHSQGLYLNPHTGAKSSVGIGKVPTSDTKLSIQVKGSQSAFRVYDDSGSVRLRHVNGGLVIGEATAPSKNGLRVKGASTLTGNVTASGLLSVGKACDSRYKLQIKAGANQSGLHIADSANTTRLWQTNGGLSVGSRVTPPKNGLYVTGNVGVGVKTPKAKLHVAGKIICEQELKVAEVITKDVKVDMNNAADYVFDDDYVLKPLREVEDYVKVNKHLPGIPSADEMAKNGVSVSEMSNLLLEKVEELTLHLIRLEKENEKLKALLLESNKE